MWRKPNEIWRPDCLGKAGGSSRVSATFWGCIMYNRVWTLVPVDGMTKYRKRPQRSITQDHRGSAIPQRTHKGTLWAKLQETGTNWTEWCLSNLAHSLQCLYCGCLVVTSRWFALPKICELRNENNCYVISITVTSTYRLSTVKLWPTDVPEPTHYGKLPLPTDNYWLGVFKPDSSDGHNLNKNLQVKV